ncbi:MAG: hypothetical protein Q4G39_00735 [Brachymonas sp.]|nr:hypothetical protein [Brachymonas sp.]
MNRVTFKILEAGTYAKIVRSKLPFSQLDGETVVVQSQLPESASLNDHLVWLWGILQNERRVLKNAAASGATLQCECMASKGVISLFPNGAEMLHLLGVELIIHTQ